MPQKFVPRIFFILAMSICMVSMATHNAFILNGDVPSKSTIQAVFQSRLLTLVPNESLGIDLSLHGQICKFSNLNIHEYY